ncbi:hypothetical protein Q9X96_003091 [Vibrio vulnificus]|nr:hypothetical protein [Vibrio vulnificus]
MIQRAIYDIEIYRGDTPIYTFGLTDKNEETGEEVPVDITNHTIKGQVRYTPDSSEVWFEFPIVKTDPTNGIFKFAVTKEMSDQLLPAGSIEPDTAEYDMQIELNNSVFTFMHGKFRVTRDITRV